jgi:hypothetical protein
MLDQPLDGADHRAPQFDPDLLRGPLEPGRHPGDEGIEFRPAEAGAAAVKNDHDKDSLNYICCLEPSNRLLPASCQQRRPVPKDVDGRA